MESKGTYFIWRMEKGLEMNSQANLESLKDKKKSIYMPLFKYLYSINTKRLKSESLTFFYLWHGCQGHISDKCVNKLHKFGNLRSFDYESCDTLNVV